MRGKPANEESDNHYATKKRTEQIQAQQTAYAHGKVETILEGLAMAYGFPDLIARVGELLSSTGKRGNDSMPSLQKATPEKVVLEQSEVEVVSHPRKRVSKQAIAQKALWAAMTQRQKAARLNKMRKARAAK